MTYPNAINTLNTENEFNVGSGPWISSGGYYYLLFQNSGVPELWRTDDWENGTWAIAPGETTKPIPVNHPQVVVQEGDVLHRFWTQTAAGAAPYNAEGIWYEQFHMHDGTSEVGVTNIENPFGLINNLTSHGHHACIANGTLYGTMKAPNDKIMGTEYSRVQTMERTSGGTWSNQILTPDGQQITFFPGFDGAWRDEDQNYTYFIYNGGPSPNSKRFKRLPDGGSLSSQFDTNLEETNNSTGTYLCYGHDSRTELIYWHIDNTSWWYDMYDSSGTMTQTTNNNRVYVYFDSVEAQRVLWAWPNETDPWGSVEVWTSDYLGSGNYDSYVSSTTGSISGGANIAEVHGVNVDNGINYFFGATSTDRVSDEIVFDPGIEISHTADVGFRLGNLKQTGYTPIAAWDVGANYWAISSNAAFGDSETYLAWKVPAADRWDTSNWVNVGGTGPQEFAANWSFRDDHVHWDGRYFYVLAEEGASNWLNDAALRFGIFDTVDEVWVVQNETIYDGSFDGVHMGSVSIGARAPDDLWVSYRLVESVSPFTQNSYIRYRGSGGWETAIRIDDGVDFNAQTTFGMQWVETDSDRLHLIVVGDDAADSVTKIAYRVSSSGNSLSSWSYYTPTTTPPADYGYGYAQKDSSNSLWIRYEWAVGAGSTSTYTIEALDSATPTFGNETNVHAWQFGASDWQTQRIDPYQAVMAQPPSSVALDISTSGWGHWLSVGSYPPQNIHKYSGVLYLVTTDNTDFRRIRVLKSTDGGSSWISVDTSGSSSTFDTTSGPIMQNFGVSVLVGSALGIYFGMESNEQFFPAGPSRGEWLYSEMDLSTETWTVDAQLIRVETGTGDSYYEEHASSFTYRATDGALVIVMDDQTPTAALDVYVRSAMGSGGTWSNPHNLATTLRISKGVDDGARIHYVFQSGSGQSDGYYHRPYIESTESFGSQTTITTAVSTTSQIWDQTWGFGSRSSTLHLFYAGTDDKVHWATAPMGSDSPTWTLNGAISAGTVRTNRHDINVRNVGSDMWICWLDPSNNFRYMKYDGTSWGPELTEAVVGTVPVPFNFFIDATDTVWVAPEVGDTYDNNPTNVYQPTPTETYDLAHWFTYRDNDVLDNGDPQDTRSTVRVPASSGSTWIEVYDWTQDDDSMETIASGGSFNFWDGWVVYSRDGRPYATGFWKPDSSGGEWVYFEKNLLTISTEHTFDFSISASVQKDHTFDFILNVVGTEKTVDHTFDFNLVAVTELDHTFDFNLSLEITLEHTFDFAIVETVDITNLNINLALGSATNMVEDAVDNQIKDRGSPTSQKRIYTPSKKIIDNERN